MRKSDWAAIAVCLLTGVWASGADAKRVALITDSSLPAPAQYGLERLEHALEAKGFRVERWLGAEADFTILAGIGGTGGPASRALQSANAPLPSGPEALAIRRTKEGLVLCGADARGLMYAILAAAAEGPDVREVSESPYVRERGVSMYTMHRRYFESRLYDENYWQRYFDLLAESRVNNFVVIFGYENGGFLAPVYPYFFDTAGFPEVRFTGLTPEQQHRNAVAFHAMIRIAHERGIDVTAAIWDHIYRGGVQGGGIAGANETVGKALPWLVTGLTEQNLVPYTQAALRQFIEEFPELDALQFRMHDESGLKKEEMGSFWHDVFAMLQESHPKVRLDLRAKELPDSIIEDALAQGLNARVSTKYWMEQMGLPFHPSHVNVQNQHDRRHGYADLLHYPRKYGVHWQLWNGGTARLLEWADPEYVRRFAASTHLYGGDSFDVNEMLATKMLGEPHDDAPRDILNSRYRYYDYEFERYWNFYQLWGRLAYNPGTPPVVWEREFQRRMGGRAGIEAMQALQLASGVLPRIVAAAYLYKNFPTTRGWAEMSTQGDLAQFAAMEGSDTGQFMSLRERAHGIVTGEDDARKSPEATAQWFAGRADEILRHATLAQQAAGEHPVNELISALTDTRILAGLARFYAHRLRAGLSYCLFEETGDLFSLDDAIVREKQAMQAWGQIVAAAGDVYREDLAFGVERAGFPRHWKQELPRLAASVHALEDLRSKARPASEKIAHVPVWRAAPGSRVAIRATISGPAGAVAQVEGATIPMKQTSPGMFEAEIAAPSTPGRLSYFIEAGAVRTPPIEMRITSDLVEPPRMELSPAPEAKPGVDLEIAVKADDPSGIRSVRLRYRHLTQYEDYRSVPMIRGPASSVYRAAIPGAFITREWDVMYYVEAIDEAGNGTIAPDLEREAPYRVATVKR
jgi:hypothetical protein